MAFDSILETLYVFFNSAELITAASNILIKYGLLILFFCIILIFLKLLIKRINGKKTIHEHFIEFNECNESFNQEKNLKSEIQAINDINLCSQEDMLQHKQDSSENISVEENNKPIKTNKSKKFNDISKKRKYLIEKILKLEQSRLKHKDKNWEGPVIDSRNKIIEANVR